MKGLDSVMEAQAVPRVWSRANKEIHQQHACTVVETETGKKILSKL